MRITVTGGNGRLGVSVVRHLAARGHEVTSIDRIEAPASPARQIVANLGDNEAAQAAISAARPQALIHLAAIAVPFSFPEHVIWKTNVTVAFQTVQAALAQGADRVLIASSPTPVGYGAPIGWLPDYLPIDEEHPLRPWNAYALSKMTMESIAAMFAAQQGSTVALGAFRPCYVISPAEWRGAPTQQGHTVSDRLDDPALAAGSLFNYVDARDVAEFVDLWIDAAPELRPGETFFVGAADAMARKPLAELMPEYLPGSGDLAAGLTGTLPAFSTAKAAALLGWTPKRSWRTELVSPSTPRLSGTSTQGA